MSDVDPSSLMFSLISGDIAPIEAIETVVLIAIDSEDTKL